MGAFPQHCCSVASTSCGNFYVDFWGACSTVYTRPQDLMDSIRIEVESCDKSQSMFDKASRSFDQHLNGVTKTLPSHVRQRLMSFTVKENHHRKEAIVFSARIDMSPRNARRNSRATKNNFCARTHAPFAAQSSSVAQVNAASGVPIANEGTHHISAPNHQRWTVNTRSENAYYTAAETS